MKRVAAALAAVGVFTGAAAFAQTPPEIADHVRANPPMDSSVGQLYAPMFKPEPWAGVSVTRDVAYGADPQQRLDVYAPAAPGKGKRTVIVFVHGGGFVRGDKHGAFYPDNIPHWAVDHGMVGVSIDYRLAPKDPWPAGARDLAAAIAWTRANIARSGGDPDRIIIWGHSAGANHVADYVAHPEVQGPEAATVKGAVILSAFYADTPAGNPANAYYGSDLKLQSAGDSIARLERARIPLFVAGADHDPDGFQAYGAALRADLCKVGRCPAGLVLKDHNHFSEGMAVGTPDEQLTGPLLSWIRALR